MLEGAQAKAEGLSTSLKRLLREYAESLLLALLLALFIRSFVFSAYSVPNLTMAPNLLVGDVVLANKFRFSRFFDDPIEAIRRGQVLVFQCPGVKNRHCMSRVVGMPGDEVVVTSGRLSVNGHEFKYDETDLPEHWRGQPNIGNFSHLIENFDGGRRNVFLGPQAEDGELKLVVPPGELFFLSDHRTSREDSRKWGTVKVKRVVAKVTRILVSFDWGVGNESEGRWVPGFRWNRVGEKP